MLLTKLQFGADDNLDMIDIRLDRLRPRVPYQLAFEIAHALRLECKRAARCDREPATFVYSLPETDLKDCPDPHRGFRRSQLTPNVGCWKTGTDGALVWLGFDGIIVSLGYEDGMKLHSLIRRAGRRAKAWAGDTARQKGLRGMLTSAEDDYRLGLV